MSSINTTIKKIAIPNLLILMWWCSTAHAICPLCTIFVGAGIGLTKWLGIDDTITGLWIGGLTVSLILWTLVWLDKKHFRFKGQKIIVALAYYLTIIAPLYFSDIIGNPANVLWGIDKLALGSILGSIFFLISTATHFYLKKHNHNRVYFPFQKVVLPASTLIILSGIFYLITK